MQGNHLVVLVLSVAWVGCGDNSTTCGPGTTDTNGVCAPVASCGSGTMDDGTGTCVPSSTVCGPGTMLDPVTNTCTVASGDCQDGTVLVGDQCVDPTGMLTIDLQEGPEPNGMGLDGVECAFDPTAQACTTPPAGTIALKPSGQSFVVHGHTTPFQDENHDGETDIVIDTYVVSVTGPTLLHVSVDGVNGQEGGFLSVANAATGDPLATYRRIGVNVTGDTANREIMLPGAGMFLIGVTDARSLTLGSAFGDSDSEYYLSITQEDLPSPEPLTVTAGQATQLSDTIDNAHDRFYAAPMAAGLHEVVVVGTPSSVFAPAFEIITNDAVRADAEETFDPVLGFDPPEVVIGGFRTGDSTLIVVDPQVNAAFDPQSYTITVKAGTAVPLPVDGSSIASPVLRATPPQVNGDVVDLNTFFYDVADAGDAPGFALHFDRPVDGAVIDGSVGVISRVSLDPADHFSGTTFQDYTGQIRHPSPGRYYFLVLDHAGIPGQTSITATNTLTAVTPTAITEGTETAAIATAPFNAFSYGQGRRRVGHVRRRRRRARRSEPADLRRRRRGRPPRSARDLGRSDRRGRDAAIHQGRHARLGQPRRRAR